MEPLLALRQGLLFAHLCVFALAFAEIVHGDLRLLRQPRLDLDALGRTARIVGVSLLMLWITGIGLVALETGFDPAPTAAKPKLLAKLVVVSALSANGVLLHHLAFPMLRTGAARSSAASIVVAVLGAVSTVSWGYAAFLGSARIIAAGMTLDRFLLLYGAALAGGLFVAVTIVAPLLRQRLARHASRGPDPADLAKWEADSDARVDSTGRSGAGSLDPQGAREGALEPARQMRPQRFEA
jgi:hypothetical protein